MASRADLARQEIGGCAIVRHRLHALRCEQGRLVSDRSRPLIPKTLMVTLSFAPITHSLSAEYDIDPRKDEFKLRRGEPADAFSERAFVDSNDRRNVGHRVLG